MAGRPHVVIADTIDSTRELLRMIFQDEFEAWVSMVDGGPGLMVAAHEAVADLIVFEIGPHPPLDLEVIARLKADPATQGVPVLCLTAWGAGLTDEQLERAGCDHVIAKPFELENVIGQARRLLAQSRPARPRAKRRAG
jgi:CheY-like chemotaxis protein